MFPGPTRIIACPHCGAWASYRTLLSGNTGGKTVWTAGRMDAPMLPVPPFVVCCAGCKACHWRNKAEVVGERDAWDEQDEDETPHVEEPSEAEYYAAIRSGLAADRREEQLLRKLAWWRSNDPDRTGSPVFEGVRPDAAPAEREVNMRALLELLTENEPDALIAKAELHRELGEWDEAAAALGRIRDRKYAKAARQIRALASAQISELREVRLG